MARLGMSGKGRSFFLQEIEEWKPDGNEIFNDILDQDFISLCEEVGVEIGIGKNDVAFRFDGKLWVYDGGGEYFALEDLWSYVSAYMQDRIGRENFVPFTYYDIEFLDGENHRLAIGCFTSDKPDDDDYYLELRGDGLKIDSMWAMVKVIRERHVETYEQLCAEAGWPQEAWYKAVYDIMDTKWGAVIIPPKAVRGD